MTIPLLLTTDDIPGNPWIEGGGAYFNRGAPGIEIEFYCLVAKRMDLDLQLIRMPWKRCLRELKYGRVDGVFPSSFKPERMTMRV